MWFGLTWLQFFLSYVKPGGRNIINPVAQLKMDELVWIPRSTGGIFRRYVFILQTKVSPPSSERWRPLLLLMLFEVNSASCDLSTDLTRKYKIKMSQTAGQRGGTTPEKKNPVACFSVQFSDRSVRFSHSESMWMLLLKPHVFVHV